MRRADEKGESAGGVNPALVPFASSDKWDKPTDQLRRGRCCTRDARAIMAKRSRPGGQSEGVGSARYAASAEDRGNRVCEKWTAPAGTIQG